MSSPSSSTFKFKVKVPHKVQLPAKMTSHSTTLNREEFFEWIWSQFGSNGLIGVHEGTLLCDEAAQQGLETDSWTVDSGEAPRERDWVGHQVSTDAELYFSTREEAQKAIPILREMNALEIGEVEEQKHQDWDAEWKKSFLNAGEGVSVPPFWKIIPPWVDCDSVYSKTKFIKINPGAGFGTGTHETTQLCLEAIGEMSQVKSIQEQNVLDFGSGSGILAIGMSLLGAKVDAVEIDPLAIDNATENAVLNFVQSQIQFQQFLPESDLKYRYIIANILKPVLLEFAEKLVQRLQPEGVLVLSGLIEKDVAEVKEKYERLMKRPLHRLYEKGEWRAMVFKSS